MQKFFLRDIVTAVVVRRKCFTAIEKRVKNSMSFKRQNSAFVTRNVCTMRMCSLA